MPSAPFLRCAVAVLLSAAAPVAAADDGWSLAPSASAPGGRPYRSRRARPARCCRTPCPCSTRAPAHDRAAARRGRRQHRGRRPHRARRREVHGHGRVDRLRGRPGRPPGPGAHALAAGARAHPGRRAVHRERSGGRDARRPPRRGRGGRRRPVLGGPGPAAGRRSLRCRRSPSSTSPCTAGASYELVNRGNTVLTPKLAVRADGVLGRALDRAPRTLPLDLPPGRRVTLTEPARPPDARRGRRTADGDGGGPGTRHGVRVGAVRAVGRARGHHRGGARGAGCPVGRTTSQASYDGRRDE